MSPEMIGLIGIIFLLVLIFMRVWLGFAMITAGFIGYILIDGWRKAFLMLGTEPYSQVSDLSLTTIPLFILMGAVIANADIGKDLFITARAWVGRLRGGLAAATVVACACFAAVCGFTAASAITVGKIAMPEMRRYKYDENLSAAVCVAGGTIGIMIPPSIAFIIYGLLTQQSIGQLFLAGFIPGILQAIMYIITIFIIVKVKPSYGPGAPDRYTWGQKIKSLKLTGPVAIIFIIAFGGIYLGLFTPTEAGAMGAFGALAVAMAFRRLKWNNFKATMLETTMTTAMVVAMMVGAYIFSRFVAISNLPFLLSETLTSLGLSSLGFIICISVFYLIMGCVLDIFSVIILTVPIIMPTVIAMGFDPIWFGVITVRLIQIGLMTPPIGMDVFTFGGAMKIKTGPLFKGVTPFVISDVVHLVILLAIPELSLLLVSGL